MELAGSFGVDLGQSIFADYKRLQKKGLGQQMEGGKAEEKAEKKTLFIMLYTI